MARSVQLNKRRDVFGYVQYIGVISKMDKDPYPEFKVIGKGSSLDDMLAGEQEMIDRKEFLELDSQEQLNFALAQLFQRTYEMVNGTAKEKGYRGMYSVTGPIHASRETMLKLKRHEAKGNPEDLVKAIGWIALLYRDDLRKDDIEG